MTTETKTYEETAHDFLLRTGVDFKAVFVKNAPYFSSDTDSRDIYEITLCKGRRVHKFTFGASITDSGYKVLLGGKNGQSVNQHTTIKISRNKIRLTKNGDINLILFEKFGGTIFNPNIDTIIVPVEPTAYKILSSPTKSDPGTFEDFCSDLGYDPDSIIANKTYNNVVKEYAMVCALWSDDEIEELQKID